MQKPASKTIPRLMIAAIGLTATVWAALDVAAAPAVGNGVVVLGTGDQAGGKGGVYALSTEDGSLLFGYEGAYAVLSGPSIAGSSVVVGDAGGNVMAFGP